MDQTDPLALGSTEMESIFPRAWLSGEMINDEVQERCDFELRDGPPSTQAVIGLGWTPARTARFIGNCTRDLARPEAWRHHARTWIMSLHRTDKPSADVPLGFVGFRPELGYDPGGGPALQFRLNLDLVWVAPPVRERGYGLHLVAHLLRYLEAHPIPVSHFGHTIRGLEVTVVRREDVACRWFAAKIAASLQADRFFTSLSETNPGQPLPPWPVLTVDVSDGD